MCFLINVLREEYVGFSFKKTTKTLDRINAFQLFITNIYVFKKPLDIFEDEMKRLKKYYKEGSSNYYTPWRYVSINVMIKMINELRIGFIEVEPPKKKSKYGDMYCKPHILKSIILNVEKNRDEMIEEGLEYCENILKQELSHLSSCKNSSSDILFF